MEEIIKSSLIFYISVTVFMGIWVLLVVQGIFRKTTSIENKTIKITIRFGICSVLVCLWIWCIVCINLYPISMAYYEYKYDIVEEKIGVIDSIEQEVKDRIVITIDNAEYTMVYSNARPSDIIDRNIYKGNMVKYKYGIKSKYIFDIHIANESS